MDERIVERIERRASLPGLVSALDSLPSTDLTSLLLHVLGRRATAVAPARLLERLADDRFVRPASIDPAARARIEATAFELLPDGFEAVELAPLVPLGTVALGGLSPGRAVPTARRTEVASDVTNGLALVAAARRRAGAVVVRLAACQRVVRPQVFDDPAAQAHFALFGLVTAGPAEPDWAFERAALAEHLAFHAALAGRLGRDGVRISVTPLPPAPRGPFEEVAAAAGATVDDERTHGRAYYRTAALSLDTESANVADGGFVDWGARLLANRRERMLISGVGLERLAAVSDGGR